MVNVDTKSCMWSYSQRPNTNLDSEGIKESYQRGIQEGMSIARAALGQGLPGPKNLENRKKRKARNLKRKETMRRMKEIRSATIPKDHGSGQGC